MSTSINSNIPPQLQQQQSPIVQKLATVNEQAWLTLGEISFFFYFLFGEREKKRLFIIVL
jgi:hypothetical protein